MDASGARWGIEAREIQNKGRGVFAGSKIPSGSLIFKFSGPIYTTATCPNFDESIQVGIDAWMWSSGGMDDLINHSCVPNAGLTTRRDGLWTFALTDINPGEEITYDYSTSMVDDPSDPVDRCYCEASGCRVRVGNFQDLDPALRVKYAELGALPDYLREIMATRGIDLPVSIKGPLE